jgi:hypothetical protein
VAPKKKKFAALSESGKYFRKNPKARANKDRISKEVNARPEQRKKRSKLSTLLKKQKREGTHKPGYDNSHHPDGSITRKKLESNRGDNNDSAGDRNARGKGSKKPRRNSIRVRRKS